MRLELIIVVLILLMGSGAHLGMTALEATGETKTVPCVDGSHNEFVGSMCREDVTEMNYLQFVTGILLILFAIPVVFIMVNI